MVWPDVAPIMLMPPDETEPPDTTSIVDTAVTVWPAPSSIDIDIVVVATVPLGPAGTLFT